MIVFLRDVSANGRPGKLAAAFVRSARGVAVACAFAALAGHAVRAEGTQGVPEPEGYRTSDYRTPVPVTLKGAKVITADEAETLLAAKEAIFIDVFPRPPKPPNLPAGTVWRDPQHLSIAGTHWLPNVGYGVLSPEFEAYFKTRMEKLTGGDKHKPVAFFCLKDCWMSWNAGKRAMSWGYSRVIWFPEGNDGWLNIGNDLTNVEPVP